MGRQIGSNNFNAKLTEQEVEAIRYRVEVKREKAARIRATIDGLKKELSALRKTDTIPALASDFEVSEAAIKNILYGDVWGHV